MTGGKSLADVVGGVVKFMMRVPLQHHCNWCSLKGKQKFGHLAFAVVLCSKHRYEYFFSLYSCSGVSYSMQQQ